MSKELAVIVEEDPFLDQLKDKEQSNIKDEWDLTMNIHPHKMAYAFSYQFLPVLNGIEH